MFSEYARHKFACRLMASISTIGLRTRRTAVSMVGVRCTHFCTDSRCSAFDHVDESLLVLLLLLLSLLVDDDELSLDELYVRLRVDDLRLLDFAVALFDVDVLLLPRPPPPPLPLPSLLLLRDRNRSSFGKFL